MYHRFHGLLTVALCAIGAQGLLNCGGGSDPNYSGIGGVGGWGGDGGTLTQSTDDSGGSGGNGGGGIGGSNSGGSGRSSSSNGGISGSGSGGSGGNGGGGIGGSNSGGSGGNSSSNGGIGGSDSGGSSNAGATGTSLEYSKTVDSTGATLTVAGVTLTVPQGAVSTPTNITITQTSDPVPSGYDAYSPLYRFEPAGATFTKPVTVSLPFQGDAKLATIFWSRTGTTGYERLSATIAGNVATVQVTHFSTGFVANGVEYTDPPDKSCVNERLIKGQTLSPSAVALFFEVDDCQGRPITGLTTSDFAVDEDSTKLSSEAVPTILNATGLSIFASLVIDMSSSTQSVLPQVISGAKAFVHKLQDAGNPLMVQISVEVFAGEASLTELQAPTLDETKVLAALDSLSGYKPADPSSTNLYGAVISGLQKLTQARTTFESRNYGGALTSGYLVLFTDGGDTAGLHTQKEAITAETNDPADQVMAVGLQTVDYDPSALVVLTSYGVQCTPTSCQWLITSPDQTVLDRDYAAMASRIAGQRQRTYLLGYCSPKRAGQHTVSVTVGSATTTQTAAQYQFQANSFGAGCSATTFTGACGTTAAPFQCGGLGCGACDDRTSHCDYASSQCMNGCGSAQQCPSAPNASGVCTNGACRLACSSGYVDCDGNAANGCETPLNAPNYTDPATGQSYYCPPGASSVNQCTPTTGTGQCPADAGGATCANAQAPNYTDPTTGQSYYCPPGASSVNQCTPTTGTGQCPDAGVVDAGSVACATANYVDPATGQSYYCPPGATSVSQCCPVHPG